MSAVTSTAAVPSYPVVRHLASASESEIEQITAVLVDAFEGDPFTSILLGGDLSLAPQQLRADVRAAFVSKGEVHVISNGPEVDNIIGVAIWYPSGVKAFTSEEERAFRNEFQALLPDSVRSWWTNHFIPTSSELSGRTLGSAYTLNSWSLHLFAVLKAHHGKGYGRKLFNYAEEKAKATRSSMVVKTTKEVDVRIYTRLGFKLSGETLIESPIGKGRMYIMHIDF
ncbi:hypothetical protein D9619_010802 [Psilocybe cf. subviscida]|uniref:N-acetyltransferase domain-containing protein n=1 Tax=Psilocybe cf. subviscida TaxID=2480587 RepID=A0A8H5F079_9AGAR|nr:hypothetical protein D9619_010802 [Psilocybe cf. subviscida]